MIQIKYEELRALEDALDRVVDEAINIVDVWLDVGITGNENSPRARLIRAVHALRSLDADRGVRNPSTPGQQATGQEPAHGEDSHDRKQS